MKTWWGGEKVPSTLLIWLMLRETGSRCALHAMCREGFTERVPEGTKVFSGDFRRFGGFTGAQQAQSRAAGWSSSC